jgi:hypothetical protein
MHPALKQAVQAVLQRLSEGTVSSLAGLDLHAWHVFAAVRDRYRSRELIGLVTVIQAYWVIRLLLDHHAAHVRSPATWNRYRPSKAVSACAETASVRNGFPLAGSKASTAACLASISRASTTTAGALRGISTKPRCIALTPASDRSAARRRPISTRNRAI